MSVAEGRLAAAIVHKYILPWKEKLDTPLPSLVLKRRFLPTGLVFIAAGVLYLLMTFFSKGIIPWWIGGLCLLSGFLVLIAYWNCRIYYTEDSFAVQNYFRSRHTYSYQEIQAATTDTKRIWMELNRKTLKLGVQDIGRELFLETARQKAAFPLDKKPPKKVDPFHGNINQETTEKMVACFWVVNAILAFALLCMIGFHFAFYRLPQDLEEQTLWFTQYEIRNNDLILYTSEEKPFYRISNYETAVSESHTFLKEIDHIGQCTIQTAYQESEKCFEIYGVNHRGTDYMNAEEWQSRHSNSFKMFTIYWCIFWSLLLIYSGLTVYVGRHAERFSNKVLHIFFRPDAINRNHNS